MQEYNPSWVPTDRTTFCVRPQTKALLLLLLPLHLAHEHMPLSPLQSLAEPRAAVILGAAVLVIAIIVSTAMLRCKARQHRSTAGRLQLWRVQLRWSASRRPATVMALAVVVLPYLPASHVSV